jgi:hypothetical protein
VGWARTPAAARGGYLREMADLIDANSDRLAELVCEEVGKPLEQARGEVDFAAVAICPWNFPLAVLCRKLGPALVTGNTVVIKPGEISPFATLEFVRLVDEQIGLPGGVINLVCGAGQTGEALVRSPLASLVSFTPRWWRNSLIGTSRPRRRSRSALRARARIWGRWSRGPSSRRRPRRWRARSARAPVVTGGGRPDGGASSRGIGTPRLCCATSVHQDRLPPLRIIVRRAEVLAGRVRITGAAVGGALGQAASGFSGVTSALQLRHGSDPFGQTWRPVVR